MRQEGIAEAQVGFRRQNEAIQASADALAMLGPRFFNVSGHETASVEAGAETVVVVDDLTVVEKVGVAGRIAAAGARLDPT